MTCFACKIVSYTYGNQSFLLDKVRDHPSPEKSRTFKTMVDQFEQEGYLLLPCCILHPLYVLKKPPASE